MYIANNRKGDICGIKPLDSIQGIYSVIFFFSFFVD